MRFITKLPKFSITEEDLILISRLIHEKNYSKLLGLHLDIVNNELIHYKLESCFLSSLELGSIFYCIRYAELYNVLNLKDFQYKILVFMSKLNINVSDWDIFWSFINFKTHRYDRKLLLTQIISLDLRDIMYTLLESNYSFLKYEFSYETKFNSKLEKYITKSNDPKLITSFAINFTKNDKNKLFDIVLKCKNKEYIYKYIEMVDCENTRKYKSLL